MLNLINSIVARAQANRQRIVLPEGTEERTLKAANQILTDEVADLILLGNPEEINAAAAKWGLGNINRATIIDPENHPKKEEYAQLLCELRKKKGMTIEEARKLVLDPLYLGCLIIKSGDADGQLAGARNDYGRCASSGSPDYKDISGDYMCVGCYAAVDTCTGMRSEWSAGDGGCCCNSGSGRFTTGTDCRLYSAYCSGGSRDS